MAHKATEAVGKLREARFGLPGERKEAAKILHAIEALARSWHKIQGGKHSSVVSETSDFNKGRAQQSAYAISLLLGVGQRQVIEALENGWL